MEDKSLIEQALAAIEASKASLGDSIEMSPQQALVYNVYLAVKERHRSYGSEAQVERSIRQARNVGIPEHEIEAAAGAAER